MLNVHSNLSGQNIIRNNKVQSSLTIKHMISGNEIQKKKIIIIQKKNDTQI